MREEHGLAYSIFSDLNPYRDTGTPSAFMRAHSSANCLQVIDSIMSEFRRLKFEALPEEELQRAKDQLKGNIMLGLESSMSRMSNLARQEMYFEYFFGIDEIMDKVEAITREQVMEMANTLFEAGEGCGHAPGAPGWPESYAQRTGLLNIASISDSAASSYKEPRRPMKTINRTELRRGSTGEVHPDGAAHRHEHHDYPDAHRDP